MQVASVIVDVPARSLHSPFDYSIPDEMIGVEVGCTVLVEFGSRPAIGYVVAREDRETPGTLKPLVQLLSEPLFTQRSFRVACWIADEYLAPVSECVRLFLPPGGAPKLRRELSEDGKASWVLHRPQIGPVDDRWATLTSQATSFVPSRNATSQRALIDALGDGPVRVAELTAELGSIGGALRSLSQRGIVGIEMRRRSRASEHPQRTAVRHATLTDGQSAAVQAILTARAGDTVLIDGVTGSGKTEIYLRAIESVLSLGKAACVLVPEISLTPQTVGRFRSRFSDNVAVLHSRLSAGERFDQWDRVRTGEATVVVGARSALFAPIADLGLIVIDEEHESSYKQGSAPRYHARDVARRLAGEHGCPVVLGSASPSLESIVMSETPGWTRVTLPERATGGQVSPVEIVDLAAEFAAGHRLMLSRRLTQCLTEVHEAGSKAVLLLNRRGFASFLLCRECGFVPTCDSCTTSMTYHESGSRLACHHCGAVRSVPGRCPRCESPYLRRFGGGTQRVENEVATLFPGWPIVRMDADTTKGRGGHERLLAGFEAAQTGVLLGTQMIAKGLDYPEVTLVGVITADVTLNLPDFRAGERTFQLLEQVAGRAGRGSEEGRVIIQTYWPEHPAIRAVALHDPEVFYGTDRASREELGYPPYGRIANILVRGRNNDVVASACRKLASDLSRSLGEDVRVLGPSPAPLARLKEVWRWHILLKCNRDFDLPAAIAPILSRHKVGNAVSVAVDIDPIDLL